VKDGIGAPEVADAIQELRAARERCAGIAAETRDAEASLAGMAAEVEAAQARLAEHEMDLARSGAPLPEGPLAEESEILRLDRQRRVLAARAEVWRSRLRESQEEVQRLDANLRAAWIDWGKRGYSRAIAEYLEAAGNLRDLYCLLHAWKSIFANAPDFPDPGYLVVENPLAKRIEDRWVVRSEFFDVNSWRPTAGDVHAALLELRGRVEEARAEQPTQISEG
jgi:hypothetical protein